MGAEYEVHAIRHAARDGRRGRMFVDADPHDGPKPMDYFAWVARSADRVVGIASGFSREGAERRGQAFLRCPAGSPRLPGIAPGAVSDVILTHPHNDHAGNLDRYPNARFHPQERGMAFATGRHLHFARCGCAEFHAGEGAIADGITLHPGGIHRPGLQVRVCVDQARPARARLRRRPPLREHRGDAPIPAGVRHRRRAPGSQASSRGWTEP